MFFLNRLRLAAPRFPLLSGRYLHATSAKWNTAVVEKATKQEPEDVLTSKKKAQDIRKELLSRIATNKEALQRDRDKRKPNSIKAWSTYIWEDWIKAPLHHLWLGTKLFGLNIKYTHQLLKKVNRGESLSRRELSLLMITITDLFRMVPFSLFILIPGGELALPIALKLFPNMKPSTFQGPPGLGDHLLEVPRLMDNRNKLKRYFVDTCYKYACFSKDTEAVLDAILSGRTVSSKDLKPLYQVVKDKINVLTLPTEQLEALCLIIDGKKPFSENQMRIKITRHIETVSRDNRLILKDFHSSQSHLPFHHQQVINNRHPKRILDSDHHEKTSDQAQLPPLAQESAIITPFSNLTRQELLDANKLRGMRHPFQPMENLQKQLEWWLDLVQDPQVPRLLPFIVGPEMVTGPISVSGKLDLESVKIAESLINKKNADPVYIKLINSIMDVNETESLRIADIEKENNMEKKLEDVRTAIRLAKEEEARVYSKL